MPFDQPEPWYCVVVPPVEVLTGRVFADLELTGDSSRRTITDLMSDEVRNDLEFVTCRLYPIVGRCLEWLRGFGDAQMTGSGAGLFIDVPDRARGLEILSQAPSGCDGFVARGVNQMTPSFSIHLTIDSYVLHMDVGSVRIETPLQEKRIAAVHRWGRT